MNATSTASEQSKCHVLICADSEEKSTYLVKELAAIGCDDVATITNPRNTVSKLELHKRSLLMLDISTPHFNGLEIIHLVRQEYSADELPILVVTGINSKETRNAALLAGANDFLTRPIDSIEMSLRVRHLFAMQTSFYKNLSVQEELERKVADRTANLDMLIENGLLMSRTREKSTLIRHTLFEGQRLLNCDAASMYLVTEEKSLRFAMRTREDELAYSDIPLYSPTPEIPNEHFVSTSCALWKCSILIDDVYKEKRFDLSGTRSFDAQSGYRSVSMLTVPMLTGSGEVIGVLQFINKLDPVTGEIISFPQNVVPLVEALAAQAAITIDNLQLVEARKHFMESLIHTIATAIDAKSPYTGRHSERVPALAVMLAEAADATMEGPLAQFRFKTEDEWHEFRVGAWLHDCGKITTPEHIIDKATKLETIYNRIHEIRMRFEVLLRDAEIEQLRLVAAGGNVAAADAAYENKKKQLQDGFAFIAQCNLGSETMDASHLDRIREIGSATWMRNFDDCLGLAQEELISRQATPTKDWPVMEFLLADAPHHLVERGTADLPDPNFGFNVDVPRFLHNHGEIYNLAVARGTLTTEDRYKINEHMIHGIMMLERMPFPKSLKRVPEYAGTHHETLIGSGYPRRLDANNLSVPARIMAIADIFEALTASDRPYKTAKKFSESLNILYALKRNGHIDPDLFDLFLTSGVHQRYAEKFLSRDQIDTIDISAYLGPVVQ